MGSNNNMMNSNNFVGNLSGNDDISENMFLKGLDDNLDLEQEAQDEDDQAEAETLQELEKRKEEIMEEFLEYAFAKKHEAIEQIKQECKKNKTPKDQEKKLILEKTKEFDLKRKEGMNELMRNMNNIIYNDEDITVSGAGNKLERLQDKEQIQAFIESLFVAKSPAS